MIRIATRKSRLALWQSEHVAGELRQRFPGIDVRLVTMSTRGDEILDRSLAEIGGKGLFLKELERAIVDNEADIAVHSLKDVPAQMPPGLMLAAFLPGADWRDCWISTNGRKPGEMPPGSRVGTSSLRRQSQLLAQFPHLEIVAIRGNVQTRLEHLHNGGVDAVVLARAGLDRLDLLPKHALDLEAPEFLPAPGQGVIVVQTRVDDAEVTAKVSALGCAQTTRRVVAERALVRKLGGDCRMPLAALASERGEQLELIARLGSADGQSRAEVRVVGKVTEAEAIGIEAGRQIMHDEAGMRILSQF